MSKTPSASEIHAMFSMNLRLLVNEKQMKISQLCREIGVNRTQFNRYLSGEANPRPDVLYRICSYFGVDGRIVLEPLPHSSPDAPSLDCRRAGRFLFGDTKYHERRNPPPSGIHRYWQTSSARPGWINSYTVRIFVVDDTTVFRALNDPGFDGESSEAATYADRREVRGLVIEQLDGLVMHAYLRAGNRISFSFLNYPVSTVRVIYPGLTMVGRPAADGVTRLERSALEVLPQDKRLRERLRDRGGRYVDDMPDHLRNLLKREKC